MLKLIYRKFVERPLWWFLAKVKAFFFAETLDHLAAIERRIQVLENTSNRLFDELEARNEARWDQVEQLILAVLSRPAGIQSRDSATPLD